MVAAPVTLLSARPSAAPRRKGLDDQLRLLLTSGGDERLWPDPLLRRNRYGAPAAPAPDELWYSSSTASAISPEGWRAAGEALERLLDPAAHCSPEDFVEDIRARLLRLVGAPGAQAALCASGTEAELLVLFLALNLSRRPVVNIVVAPAETGSGVPAAADGRHFLGHASAGGPVSEGARLDGWEEASIQCRHIAVREPGGRLLPHAQVDAAAAEAVQAAADAGAFTLLHVMDASKTGHAGVSRAAAQAIAARHRDNVLVVVDACQLRCSWEVLRADLAAGFAVMITGSKFAGGPPFSGALLLPAGLCERLADVRPGQACLRAYSARLDWPAPLRMALAERLRPGFNLGLALRWTAALDAIEDYAALPEDHRGVLLARFDAAVRARVRADPALSLLDEESLGVPGLVPVVHADGSDARLIHETLALPASGNVRPCHLGQPVEIGATAALRVCASMPLITRAAHDGFAVLEDELDEVFEAWALARRACR